MTVFYHEEPQNPSKRCKFLSSCLKDAFSNCHVVNGKLSTPKPEDEYQTSDFGDEEDVIVSAIRSGALEKLRKKPILLMAESFSWVYSPTTKQLYVTTKGLDQKDDMKDSVENYEKEEFLSAKSCFSCCSSNAVSRDVFLSVKTSFSRSSSSSNIGGVVDWKELQRRSIIQEFCHCEGWPFGLCRKAVLLPPLPKSPAESWTWHKGTKATLKLTN